MAKIKIGEATSDRSLQINGAEVNFARHVDKSTLREWYPTNFEVWACHNGIPGNANYYELRFYFKEWKDAVPRKFSGEVKDTELTRSEVGWLILTGVTNMSAGGGTDTYTGSTELAEGEVRIVDVSGNKRVGWMINGQKKYFMQNSGTIGSTGDTFEAAEHFSHFSKFKITEATPAHFQQKYGYTGLTLHDVTTVDADSETVAVAVADIADAE